MPPKGNSLRFRGQEFFDRSYDSSPMRDIDYSKKAQLKKFLTNSP